MKKTIISILTLSMINVIGVTIGNDVSNVSALTYSDNVGVNFAFSPSLTVSLSSPDIVINDLTPGSSSDSNVVTVNVLSNNLSGYNLNSTVGNSTHTNPSYDTRNLVHGNTSSNAVFASLDYGSSIASLNSSDYDNQWGYTYSTDNSTWSNYSGLPKYDDTVNITTLRTATGPSSSTGDNTYFKIAAKASTAQASGTYSNVINFTVTAEHNPVSFYDAFKEASSQPGSTIATLNGYYKMQDMNTSICNSVYTSQLADNTDTMEAQLIDIRDNNIYWVAKLKDGHCWMTQNLDLNLDSSVALTSEDTDLTDHSLTGAYADGYTYDADTGVTTWKPANSTIDAVTDENTSGNITGWNNNPYASYSLNPGKWYWKGSDFYSSNDCLSNNNNQTCNYIAKSNARYSTYFTAQQPLNADGHYATGDYYNLPAAIASDNASSLVGSTTLQNIANNPQNSVCPKNWRLPTVYGGSNIDDKQNEFYVLNKLYNNSSSVNSRGLEAAPLFLTRNGGINDNSLNSAGAYAVYWSSTIAAEAADNPLAYVLYSFSYKVLVAEHHGWIFGYAVRCLSR